MLAASGLPVPIDVAAESNVPGGRLSRNNAAMALQKEPSRLRGELLRNDLKQAAAVIRIHGFDLFPDRQFKVVVQLLTRKTQRSRY